MVAASAAAAPKWPLKHPEAPLWPPKVSPGEANFHLYNEASQVCAGYFAGAVLRITMLAFTT